MTILKYNRVELFETLFGLAVFMIIVFAMQGHIVVLFEQMEWYRAVAVTLGGITVAGAIGIVSSFSAMWIIQNISMVVVAAILFWGLRLAMI
ncbi:MAG: hypothetical protein COB07_07595 [Sulfurovum sp.]|nr:MAG: hypothetical protein COB07_07595 [Sulfurovum sp.]